MRGIALLHPVEQAQRVVVARPRPDRAIEPRHGLEIVVVDVGPGIDDLLERAGLAQEVRGQHLDRGLGRGRADAPDAGRELKGAAVGQVVAIDRGDHDVLETELAQRLGQMQGLLRIDAPGQPRLDVAEAAGAGAGVAQDHHRGVALGPALADVGAGRLLAHRVQPLRAHQLAGGVVARRGRRLDPDPGRLAPRCDGRRADDLGHGLNTGLLASQVDGRHPGVKRRNRGGSLHSHSRHPLTRRFPAQKWMARP